MGQQIAETTLAQLGGHGRLRAMIGAEMFTHDEHGTLRFRFKGYRKANTLEVTLDPTDTYTMRFLKVTNYGLNAKEVKTYDGVYCDQLKEIFERETGLYLSL